MVVYNPNEQIKNMQNKKQNKTKLQRFIHGIKLDKLTLFSTSVRNPPSNEHNNKQKTIFQRLVTGLKVG
jgi:hypothetical protein